MPVTALELHKLAVKEAEARLDLAEVRQTLAEVALDEAQAALDTYVLRGDGTDGPQPTEDK